MAEADARHVRSVLETTCGIPLAIELVASRMGGSLTWQEAAETLKQSFELMAVPDGESSKDKHSNMEACLNWSCERLSEPAQMLFRAISLFANGFSTSLVENCYGKLFGDKRQIRDSLEEILASSLISFIDDKWSFLPIVHRYAKDLLKSDDNKLIVEVVFISYWGSFVGEKISSEEKVMENLQLLEQEHGHLTEFLNLLLANQDYHDMYILITNAIQGFWQIEKMWGDSINYLERAIETAKNKAEKDPDEYQPYVAMTSNNLANLLQNKGNMDGAKELYEEALKTYETLAEKHPDAYLPDVAGTSNNLAVLLKNAGDMDGAKGLYEEALKTYKTLAEKHPDAYLPYVATTSNNLAVLLSDTGDMDGAKGLYEEALGIRRTLAEKHPDAYLPYVAMTSNNLANLLSAKGDMDGAKRLYEEALRTYKTLAEKHPNAYLPYVATTSNNLANLLSAKGDMDGAKRLYEEALRIRRTLAEKHPDAYLPYVATTSNNLAVLLSAKGDMDGAKELYEEALKTYKTLAEKHPDAYLLKLATVCQNFANLLVKTGEVERAVVLYNEVEDINKRMK
ncbi:MAG: tetratricopeptide repeat protein [Nitrospirota bacterium]